MIGHCYIQGVEKHIKAIYVGVAGKAKSIYKRKYSFSLRTDSLGSGITLTNKSRAFASGSTGQYVIAAGGMGNSTSTRFAEVDAFDSSYTKSALTPLTRSTSSCEGISFNSSVIVAGGYCSSGYSSSIYVYTPPLTHVKTGDLIEARSMVCGDINNEYAFIAGGQSGKNTKSTYVDTLNSEWTKSIAPPLTVARSSLASATIGDKTIFAGGYTESSPYYSNATDVYSSIGSKLSISTLNIPRDALAGVSNEKYAIFAGGEVSSSATTSSLETFDSNLTRGSVNATLTYPSGFISAKNVKGNVLFIGGRQTSSAYLSNVDIFDQDMVKLDPITMKNKHSYCGTGVIDKTLFVMGGNTSSSNNINAIDIICAE